MSLDTSPLLVNFVTNKKKDMKVLVKIFALVIGCIGFLNAQTTYMVESSEMSIAGTSTLHDWESSVNEVLVECKFNFENETLSGIEELMVTIPAKSIISTKGSIMDNKTWKALKHEEHPNITYQLKEVTSIEKTPEGLIFVLNGLVNLAGVEKTIDLQVTGKTLGDEKMEFQGSQKFIMTEYEMVPPTALFGQIKTGDEITVRFKVVMGAGKS